MKREKPNQPLPFVLQDPEGFIQEKFNSAREGVGRCVKDAVAYAQLEPEKALLWAAGGGYLLRMLPLTGILGALIRLSMSLLKPAALVYGGIKVWQKAEPFLAPRTSPKSS